MISFFPDVNVWLALSIADHSHSEDAWRWLGTLASDARLAFGRYTQLGMLRLLTNPQVMGAKPLTLAKAWEVYDRWLEDPRVEYFAEPRSVDTVFRDLTKAHASQPATKSVGDCWLLACSSEMGSTLVTFDRALLAFARRNGRGAVIPS
jgi:toxin-antitoxin system PIN domain toxin